MIEPTIRVTKKFEVTLRSATTPFSVTVAQLAAGIPGGLSYWNRIRFEKFDIWNDSTEPSSLLSLNVFPDSDSAQPPFQLLDHGTAGNRRSGVGFRLGLLERARFYGTADTTVIFTVQQPAGTGTQILVHVTMEMLSPQQTAPALEGQASTAQTGQPKSFFF